MIRTMPRAIAAALVAALLLWAPAGWAQAVLQAGPILNGGGHAPIYLPSSPQGLATVMDSGAAGGGPIGYGLSEKLLQARSYPGTGPLGTHDCDWDTYATNPAGANFLCFDANIGGNAVIASSRPLDFVINGQTIPFPGAAINLRQGLLGALNLYVATTGVDTGSCTSTAPCLTLQYAANQALLNYDQRGQVININIADGAYTSPQISMNGPQVGAASTMGDTPASIWFIGNIAHPDNVVITGTTGPATFLLAGGGLNVVIEGMKIVSTTGSLVFPGYGAVVDVQFDDFGNTGGPNFGMLHSETSGVVKVSGNYTISGGNSAGFIQNCCLGGQTIFIETPITVKIVGNLPMPSGFISLGMNSIVYINSNFVTFDLSAGSIIGPKYSISSSATLWAQGGTADSHNTFLPGSLPGVMAENAVYRPSGATYADARVGLGFLNEFFAGGNLNLWVATTGLDATDCQTQAQPCLTPQYAVNQALEYYDAMTHNIVVNMADGTYTLSGPIIINGGLTGGTGGSGSQPSLFIIGDQTTPSNVVFNSPSGGVQAMGAGNTTIEGIDFASSGAGDSIQGLRGAVIAVTNDVFGTTSAAHMHADSFSQVIVTGGYTVNGSAGNHFRATNQGQVLCTIAPKTITLSGTLTFSDFVIAGDLGLINCNNADNTFSVGGSVTGTRFQSSGNSVIDTSGSPNFWPGSINGATATGGQAF